MAASPPLAVSPREYGRAAAPCPAAKDSVSSTQHVRHRLPDARALTTAIRAGDGAALERLYRLRFDRLHALARARTGRDEAFCLDVVQETFVRVIRGVPILDEEGQLDAWLLKTLDRCAIDAFRREVRRSRRETGCPDGADSVGSAGTDGADDRLSQRLSMAMARLSPSDMALLEGRFRFGWTLRRIGETVGLKPGAVDGRIGRLLERLRKEIGDE